MSIVPHRRPIRVLIVDDSALVRRILRDALQQFPDIDVVDTASDPYVAREKVVALDPDVMTLDIEMPRMDGLSFLEKLMQHRPLPVIIVSSLAQHRSEAALRALALGAVDVIAKPGSSLDTSNLADTLANAIRTAARARVAPRSATTDAPPRRVVASHLHASNKLIAIGASTGGTAALETVLRAFPADAPATVIVQHMPATFVPAFAARLDSVCAMHVKEAVDGEYLAAGQAVIAPGGKHLVVQGSGARWVTRVKDGPMVHHQRPAVDVLFQSVARAAGRNAIGALLTGMGVDGAQGLRAMRDAGAFTVAQDEATSIVYGMPREAVSLGAASAVLPLDEIAAALVAGGQTATP